MTQQQRPTLSDCYRISLFGFCMFLYFSNFVTINDDRTTCFGLTGFDLIFGRMVANCYGILFRIPTDLWSIAVFFLATAGFIYSLLCLPNKGYGFLIALASIICLILFQLKFQYLMAESGTVNFCIGYWLLLANFGLLAVVDYLQKDNPPKTAQKREDSKGFIINIITQGGKEKKDVP